MEIPDLSWARLVLDGASGAQILVLFALPILCFLILVGTLAAWAWEALSFRTAVAILVTALLVWFVLFLVVIWPCPADADHRNPSAPPRSSAD